MLHILDGRSRTRSGLMVVGNSDNESHSHATIKKRSKMEKKRTVWKSNHLYEMVCVCLNKTGRSATECNTKLCHKCKINANTMAQWNEHVHVHHTKRENASAYFIQANCQSIPMKTSSMRTEKELSYMIPSLLLHSFFIYKWPRIVQFNPLETAWIHVMICLCQFLISIFVWHTIRYGKCTQYLVYVRIRCRQSHERRRKSEWAKWRAGKIFLK